MRGLFLSLLATAALAFAGCSQAVRYPAGVEKGQCYGNGTCNSGLRCSSENRCIPEVSPTMSEGGTTGTGGANQVGGQAGSNDTGGASGSGGQTESGGSTGEGGSDPSSGSSGSGGSDPSGGSSGSGGDDPTAGSGGDGSGGGGSSGACSASSSTTEVTFCNGLAVGAMTGYGWVALGSADSLTDPTCDTAQAAITEAAPCLANTNWNRADALCMSGTIPALPELPTDADYASNWGVQIGVNARDPNEGMAGDTFKTITFSMTGSPLIGLRAVLHKDGDPNTTGYCASMTPGTALAISDFNSACWDDSGTSLSDADVPSIDKVGVQVSSSAAAATVSDLCLTKIAFGY